MPSGSENNWLRLDPRASGAATGCKCTCPVRSCRSMATWRLTSRSRTTAIDHGEAYAQTLPMIRHTGPKCRSEVSTASRPNTCLRRRTGQHGQPRWSLLPSWSDLTSSDFDSCRRPRWSAECSSPFLACTGWGRWNASSTPCPCRQIRVTFPTCQGAYCSACSSYCLTWASRLCLMASIDIRFRRQGTESISAWPWSI